MKITQINTYHSVGGAAVAVMRLVDGLVHAGHETLVLTGEAPDCDGITRTIEYSAAGRFSSLGNFKKRMLRRVEEKMGLPDWWRASTAKLLHREEFSTADVVNIHNIHGGYFNFRALPFLSKSRPLVWTLHDMWPLTGACAFPYDCDRWKAGCYCCPLLIRGNAGKIEPYPLNRDQTKRIWQTKKKIYEDSDVILTTPSKWLLNNVKEGILGDKDVRYIPNGIDTDVFRPVNRDEALSVLKLDPKPTYILCSAAYFTYRKGYDILKNALLSLRNTKDVVLFVLGHDRLDAEIMSRFKTIGFGHIRNQRILSLVMAAADIFAFPSRADNNPLVVLEAMACGTPVVGFDVGGVSELIIHMESGYLAKPEDAGDFANGLKLMLENEEIRRNMGNRSRILIENGFTIDSQVKGFLDVYREACERFWAGHGK